jgi:succinoglycan biosynthesis protein ExoO
MVTEKSIDVSIIIPTYNVQNYIERAIRSALVQTGVNIEVIVIDDCSTDKTILIAEGCKDNRLTIIPLEENYGPGYARNVGIKSARGRWISVLDADDQIEIQRLSRLITKAENESADIIVDNINVFYENNNKSHIMFETSLFKLSNDIDLLTFLRGNQSFLGGYALGYLKPIFRKEFLEKHSISYLTNIKIGEDFIFMAECLANNARCITIPYAGYQYTVRNGSISRKLDLEDVRRIREGDQYLLSKYKFDNSILKAFRDREKNSSLALSFTELVKSIKEVNLFGVLQAIKSNPLCIFYLWRPVFKRLVKIFGFKK